MNLWKLQPNHSMEMPFGDLRKRGPLALRWTIVLHFMHKAVNETTELEVSR